MKVTPLFLVDRVLLSYCSYKDRCGRMGSMNKTTYTNPIIIIESADDPEEFELKCRDAVGKGYQLSSSSCVVVNSAQHGIHSIYQAILVIPLAKA